MTRRLSLLMLMLVAALVSVPVADASEKDVVAAVQSTLKPIQRASTNISRCLKVKDVPRCVRKAGPALAAAARNADRRVGAAIDGTERRCFATGIAGYRRGLRRMAVGGDLMAKGQFRAGAKALQGAGAIMQKASRTIARCG